jgi:hypothetical protein
MVDDRLVDGAQNAIRDRRRAWNLQEVAAGAPRLVAHCLVLQISNAAFAQTTDKCFVVYF